MITSIARKLLLLALAAMTVSGCETLSPVTLGVGIVSFATTGKGLADHAIGKLTQKDCNILGGILSTERKICEPLGSAAAQLGFKGFFAKAVPEPVDEGTTLRLSEQVAAPISDLQVSGAELVVSTTPVLRLSDTLHSTKEDSSRIPDRLAQTELAPSERKL